MQRTWALVGLSMLVLAGLAGCASRPAPACPATGAGTTCPAAPPVAHRTIVYDGVRQFQPQGRDPKTSFEVPNGTKRLHAEIWFNATATGTWVLLPEPGASPPPGDVAVGIDDPAKAHDVVYHGPNQGSAKGPTLIEHDVLDVDSPTSGAWTIDLDGEGSNVSVRVILTADA